MFRLKAGSPAFDVVDGPLAGRRYRHGQAYAEIPPGEAGKFERIPEQKPAGRRDAKPAQAEEGGDDR
jgi:hypothetical protein